MSNMRLQPLLKSVIWATNAFMLHYSAAPPYRKVSEKDNRPDEGWFMNMLVQSGVPVHCTFTWLVALGEILTIHSSSFRRMTSFPASADFATLNAPFLASFVIVAISFRLRLSCFRRLGEFFTPWVMVRPNHKLVTDGPYRFVRHPSYTGIIGTLIGNILLHLCGTHSVAVKVAFWIWALQLCLASAQIWPRSSREDRLLAKTFGEEWEAYRKRVPYRFIPGIL